MSRPPSPLPENAPQADLMPAAPPPTSTEPASPRVSGEQRGVTSSSSHLHETDGPATRAVPSVSTAAPAPPIDTAAPAATPAATLRGRSGERKTTEAASDPGKCPTCKGGGRKGRNLVVCIDGTSNQFSKKNTNVVELYSRLIKDENQLTFYNSGIGTYAEPSWKSWSYRKQVFMNMLDLMFALRLEKIIISAYAWLVDNYEEGDRIFLFGFSRGAYQVRALAAMLDIVGLLHKGNRDQIPFAFELYAASDRERRPHPLASAQAVYVIPGDSTPLVTTDPSTESPDIRESTSRCLPSLRGAFNTMSAGSARMSKGLRSAVSKVRSAAAGVQILAPVRAKLSQCISLVLRPGLGAPVRKFRLPQAQEQAGETSPDTDWPEITMQERFKATFSRDVKAHFLGAWDTVSSVRLIRGSTLPGTTDGMGTVCFFRHALAMHEYRVKFLPEYANGGNGPEEQAANSHNNMPPHTKEVWFIGSHSDIGGGSTVNTELDKFGPALRWMSFEAGLAGLRIKPGPRQWEEQTLVTDSMAWYYKPMEWLPVKRLTYADKKSLTLWRPHRYSERVVRPNQLIHETYLKETGTTIDDLQTEIGFEIKIEKDAYTDAQALLSVPRDQPSRNDWLQQLQILQESEPGLQSLLDLERDIWLALARSVPSYPEHGRELRPLENALVCRGSNEVDSTRRLSEVFGTSDQDTYWTYPFAHRGHTLPVSSVAFLTSQLVVSGSRDNTLRMWNIETGEAVGDPLTGHTDSINCVAVSPTGSLVASGSDDGTVRTWRFDARKLVAGGLVIRTDGMGAVFSVAFSPDGSRIVSGSADGALRIWDAATGQQIGNAIEGRGGPVWSVAFSPDGTRIVSGSVDRTVRLWDARTFQPLGDPLTGHTITVLSVAFSPDGLSIASGSHDATIRIWNSNTRELMHILAGHSYWVASVAFSPSGRHITSASGDDTVRIWDCSTGEAVAVLKGHTSGVYSVAFSPDGTRIASGSVDETVRIWDRIPVSSTDAT